MDAAPSLVITAVEPASPAPYEPIRIAYELHAGDQPVSGRIYYLSPVVPDGRLEDELKQAELLEGPDERVVVDLPAGQTTVGVVYGFAPAEGPAGRVSLRFQIADGEGNLVGPPVVAETVLGGAPA